MPEIMKAQELRRQRQELHEQNVALNQAVRARWQAAGPLDGEIYSFDAIASEEERSQYDRRDAEFERLSAEIGRLERADTHADLVAQDAQSMGRTTPAGGSREPLADAMREYSDMSEDEQQREDNDELRRYASGGVGNMTEHQRMRLVRRQMR